MSVLKVRRLEGSPDFEALPVAKLTCFPLEPRDYKPYSQARICFDLTGNLHLQLLSFEAAPLPESCMTAVLRASEQDPPLFCCLNALGEFSVRSPQEAHLASAHYFTGEDLQGVFWGGNLSVPASLLADLWPAFQPLPGTTFWGNFYKLCSNPQRPHSGCYYPADFSLPLEDMSNLGDFQIIDY